MLTLYHSPQSRSTRVVQLIHEMGKQDQVAIRTVGIARNDGSGAPDPANPHPEGKVPLLVHDGAQVRESNAVMLYLTDHFADSPLAGRWAIRRAGPICLGWPGMATCSSRSTWPRSAASTARF